MARYADREKARILRDQGKSYSEIKSQLAVSKSTLSLWLRDMPLTQEQIRLLQGQNPKRIEKFRSTMQAKREVRLSAAYGQASQSIGRLSNREIFIAGLFLYWGEGTKASRGSTSIANTDPAVIKFFLRWLSVLGISLTEVKVKLHLYEDMDVEKETTYWAKELGLPAENFRSPYVKTSKLSGLTYKTGFGHGTCNVIFENIALWEYITMGLKYIREMEAGV
jgi:hypothetical protein